MKKKFLMFHNRNILDIQVQNLKKMGRIHGKLSYDLEETAAES